jgi:hypothetical protein
MSTALSLAMHCVRTLPRPRPLSSPCPLAVLQSSARRCARSATRRRYRCATWEPCGCSIGQSRPPSVHPVGWPAARATRRAGRRPLPLWSRRWSISGSPTLRWSPTFCDGLRAGARASSEGFTVGPPMRPRVRSTLPHATQARPTRRAACGRRRREREGGLPGRGGALLCGADRGGAQVAGAARCRRSRRAGAAEADAPPAAPHRARRGPGSAVGCGL